MRVKSLGLALRLANARPPGNAKFAMQNLQMQMYYLGVDNSGVSKKARVDRKYCHYSL